jgi:small-conductance mechanosensitive channel
MNIFLRILRWVVFFLLFFAMTQEFFFFQSGDPTIHFLNIFCSLYFFWSILDLSKQFITFIYKKRKKLSPNQSDNIISGFQNIYILVMILAFVVTTLSLFGIEIGSLLTSISIFAAALAILTKDYVSNIISGMILAFSNEINLGDNVQVSSYKGKVMDITLSKFILLNENDDLIFIPNNTVFANEVINYTKRDIKKTSIEFQMNLTYVNSIPELEADLTQAISNYHHEIQENSFNLRIQEIKKDELNLVFQYILKAPNRELEQDIRKVMVRHIVHIVKAHQNRVQM